MRFFLFLSILFFTACQPTTAKLNPSAMTAEQVAVNTTLTEFLTAGDVQDAGRLAAVLDPTYRIVINQFMGGDGVTVIDRAGYLGMIEQKKLGGAARSVELKSIEVVGNLAHVRALLASAEMTFDSQFILAKDKAGAWSLVSDAPFVTMK